MLVRALIVADITTAGTILFSPGVDRIFPFMKGCVGDDLVRHLRVIVKITFRTVELTDAMTGYAVRGAVDRRGGIHVNIFSQVPHFLYLHLPHGMLVQACIGIDKPDIGIRAKNRPGNILVKARYDGRVTIGAVASAPINTADNIASTISAKQIRLFIFLSPCAVSFGQQIFSIALALNAQTYIVPVKQQGYAVIPIAPRSQGLAVRLPFHHMRPVQRSQDFRIASPREYAHLENPLL